MQKLSFTLHSSTSKDFKKRLTLDIHQKLEKDISVSDYIANRGSYMNLLSITYRNNEWRYSMVRIGSPALISFY